MPEITLWKSLTWSGYPLQGRMKIHGMDISIENRKGSVRRGVDKDGHKWKTKMHYAYGYIRGTVGRDKDHLDCYVGPNHESRKVFIVHQNDPTTGKYDEDKVMLGWDSAEEAKAAYLKQYDRPGFFGSMDEADIDTFKEKALAKENHGKKLEVRKVEGSPRYLTEEELRKHAREARRKLGLVERQHPEELAVGEEVELEHTNDPEIARIIAADHIFENPDYYKKLIAAGLVDEPKALKVAKQLGLKKSASEKRTVAIDFDGVINSYTSGWKGPAETDAPVPGAALAINKLRDRGFKVVIYSTRAESPEGKRAIVQYLSDMEVEPQGIEVSDKKPIADVYIDDRAVTFDGDWPAMLERVEKFKPWMEKSIRLVIPFIEKARRSPRLVPEKRTVTRDGRTFQTTVWVLPGEKNAPAQGGFDFDAEPQRDVKEELDGLLEVAYKQGGRGIDAFFDAVKLRIGADAEIQEEFARRFSIDKNAPPSERIADIKGKLKGELKRQRDAANARADAVRKQSSASAVAEITRMAEVQEANMQRQIQERDSDISQGRAKAEVGAEIADKRWAGDTDATLKRGRNDIIFKKPYVGKTGAKLLGYEWPHIKINEVDNRGEDVVRRYSDWTQADISEMTGRKFVHKFIIGRTDGTVTTLSAESAAVALGISEGATRARARKLLQDEIEEQKKREKAKEEFEKFDSEPWYKTPAEAVENISGGFRRRWIEYRDWGKQDREFKEKNGYKPDYSKGEDDIRFTFVPGLGYKALGYVPRNKYDSDMAARAGYQMMKIRARHIWDADGKPFDEPAITKHDGTWYYRLDDAE